MTDASRLLDRLHRGGGFGYYWDGERKLTSWHPVGNNGRVPKGRAVYFGVHTVAELPEARAAAIGKTIDSVRALKDEVSAINCLFAEFDAKDFGNDKAAALQHIRALPYPPSIIVDSGGGYHCYWLLRQTCTLATNEDREAARTLQAAWVDAMGGDDGAKDLARVLRVPGSTNAKYNPPRPVEIVEADYSREYTLDELADHAAKNRPPVTQEAAYLNERDASAPAVDFTPPSTGTGGGAGADAGASTMLANAIEAVRSAPTGQRNATLYDKAHALGGLIAAGRLDRSTAESALTMAAAGLTADDGEAQTLATIKSGIESGIERPLESRPPPPKTALEIIIGSRAKQAAALAALDAGAVDDSGIADLLRSANRTDSGNAECIAAVEGQDMRYVHDNKLWAIWDGTRWAYDRDGEAKRRARNVARARYHAAAKLSDADRITLAKWATASEQSGRITSALEMAAAHETMATTIDRYDTDKDLVATKGDTINLKKGTAYPAERADLIMRQLGTAYDASAQCPRWLKFLDEIFNGDADLIAYIQRAVGYSLTGDTREQKIFFCIGGGSNGKSVFLETLAALAGEYHASTAFSTFDAGEQSRETSITLAALHGVRLITVIESDEDRQLAEARVKSVTGQDAITARANYGKPFTYRPQFKIWLAMNHKPGVRGTDHGIWRRIALIPFTRTFEDGQKDDTLGDKLKAELPGILNWAIEGAQAWRRHGLDVPKAVEAATADYRNESDSVGRWLDDCTVAGATFSIRAAAAYLSYETWCEKEGHRAVTNKAFKRSMVDRSIKVERHANGYHYIGRQLLQD